MAITKNLSDEEWKEMDAIRRAIADHPASVHPDKLERFSELFVATLPTRITENNEQDS